MLLLLVSWIVMTFTHEFGHVAGGWCCGGTLQAAELRPWRLPFSIFDPDPCPLVTLWSGLILGVAAPIGLASLARRDAFWFVAHFCALANGVYIAAAGLFGDRYLDTPRLLEHGASPISIGVYCLFTIGWGYIGFRRDCIQALAMPRTRHVAPRGGESPEADELDRQGPASFDS